MEKIMQIDLKDEDAFTLEAVRALIASKTDSDNTQLRVTKDGIAYLSTESVGGANIQNLHLRFETWMAGNDWVGAGAASDKNWVNRIYKALHSNWPTRTNSFIDIY